MEISLFPEKESSAPAGRAFPLKLRGQKPKPEWGRCASVRDGSYADGWEGEFYHNKIVLRRSLFVII